MTLTVRPCDLREANRFVGRFHRHHKPVRGYKWALAAEDDDGKTLGVVIAGRPVARAVDARRVLEVTRLCTDGTKNACSFLYAAAARVAREMGYAAIQTYILASEPGTSLRAAGWRRDGEVVGRQWEHSMERQMRLDGHTRRADQPTEDKVRWVKVLRSSPPASSPALGLPLKLPREA